MFPSLNESIGWSRGLDSILPASTILLGDSNPIDTLPFIYSFMNFWLKPTSGASMVASNTAVIFVSFKTAQSRIISVFRKLYGLQLNLLSAQSRFAFIDASSGQPPEQILKEFDDIFNRTFKHRTLVILEGFSWILANNPTSPPTTYSSFITIFDSIQTRISRSPSSNNLLIQWSRDLEDDYPGRNPQLIEDIRLGGRGWLQLLSNCHYVFCVRPLKSGVTRDANGEIVAALGPLMQTAPTPPPFHPLLSLYRIPTDTTIQCFTKGNL